MRTSVLRRRVPLVIGVLGLAYLAAAFWLDRRGAREPEPDRYDAIIVLGCRVRPDGTASKALERRARLAARLYREGLAPRVVLTGGTGAHPPSEARAAADVVIREGVPESALILEERSTSTAENAREAARLIEAERVVVVTDAYHTFRAQRVFARHFDRVLVAGTRGAPKERAYGALREVTAVAAYAALGRL
jgi:uncharacterized SAM-binding protein YcdF (DUF218 family)